VFETNGIKESKTKRERLNDKKIVIKIITRIEKDEQHKPFVGHIDFGTREGVERIHGS
jgi:hypothetical protein